MKRNLQRFRLGSVFALTLAVAASVWAAPPVKQAPVQPTPAQLTPVQPTPAQPTPAQPTQARKTKRARDCYRPQFKSLENVSLNIQETQSKPTDCATHLFSNQSSAPKMPKLAARVFHWEASEFYHHPLYFDDTPLERYGQSVCPRLQPLLSGAHFFGSLPILPYKMGLDRYKDKIYTLGYYRPGSHAPCVRQRLPLEADAILFESGAWVALVFLFP